MKYLESNDYFGMPHDQLYVMMQDCIPAVRNLHGEIACDNEGHIIRKPHGHGDIHFCLYRVSSIINHLSNLICQDGIINQWVAKYDLHRVFFFQDTNTVNFHTMPCVAALSLKHDAHMISTCVKRKPHEQVCESECVRMIDETD